MRLVIAEKGVEYKTPVPVRTPADTYNQCRQLQHLDQETFAVLLLNGRHNMISNEIICIGLVNSTLIHSREFYRRAIMMNACSVIAVHNHPSGDPSPSSEDLKITKKLVEAGNIIDIKLIDHVIIGKEFDNGQLPYFSIRENGLVEFS